MCLDFDSSFLPFQKQRKPKKKGRPKASVAGLPHCPLPLRLWLAAYRRHSNGEGGEAHPEEGRAWAPWRTTKIARYAAKSFRYRYVAGQRSFEPFARMPPEQLSLTFTGLVVPSRTRTSCRAGAATTYVCFAGTTSRTSTMASARTAGNRKSRPFPRSTFPRGLASGLARSLARSLVPLPSTGLRD